MARITQKMNPGQAILAINNHSHSDGIGKPIPEGGIEDGAITENKIGESAVANKHIKNGTITIEKMENGIATLMRENVAAVANAPGHYSCDVPFHFYDRTVIASPNRLWLNIGQNGYMLEEQELFDISTYRAWDSKATKWSLDKRYEKNECVYIDDEKTGYIYRCTTAGTSSTIKNEFPKVLGQSINDGSVAWICEKDYSVAANRAGVDFYIYACQPKTGIRPVIVISANSTVPIGYTAENSRKVGGFHCECLDVGEPTPNHWMKNFKTGDVIPFSVWDIDHRPDSGSPEGMSWIPGHGWLGIYLVSNEGTTERKLVTKFGGTIADGTSMPKYSYHDFIKYIGLNAQKMPHEPILTVAATGMDLPGAIKNSVDPVTTGGHVNTKDKRIVSNFGIEDLIGVMWIFCEERFWANNYYISFTFGGAWNEPAAASVQRWSNNYPASYDAAYTTIVTVGHKTSSSNADVFSLIKSRLLAIQGVLQ